MNKSKRFTIEANFYKYLLVSFVALAIDYSSYISIVYLKLLEIPIAASVGYLIGMLFSYLLMSKYVFSNTWMSNKKHYEFILFLISGFLGTLITYITATFVVGIIGPHLQTAKVSAILISFTFTYFFRKKVVFKPKVNDL